MPHDATTELAGETVTLLPERALYWPRRATLFVADLHWGKAAAWRAAGVPLPGGSTSADLDRLSGCIERSGARRLALLGDLIHARAGRAEATLAAISAWRERHAALQLLLVRGNHDQHAGDPPAAWNIETVDAPYLEAPFVLRHHPEPSTEGYTLAGHLHPAVAMNGSGRQRLRLPCFWFGATVGVLPAFGGLTGSAVVAPAAGDNVFVIADDQVLRVQ